MKSPIEIQKLKIALTSDCCLACRHCGVDKARGEEVSFRDAAAAVRRLLDSPGKRKRLELYGGEPFLKFGLLKRVALYARRAASRAGKDLSLSAASNALAVKKEHLEFLRSVNASLSVSFSGRAATHDRSRVFPGGRGSFAAVKARLPLLFANMDPLDLVALDCVHPGDAGGAAADFKALARLGFRVVNVECVHGPRWTPAAMAAFRSSLEEIISFVDKSIAGGRFVYPEPLIELARCAGTGPALLDCPFYRDLELYPDGSYSFYPYAFTDYARDIGRVRVGSAASGFSGRFAGCRQGAAACSGCAASYYRLPGLSEGSFAYAARTAAFKRFFASVLRRSARSRAHREYAAGVFALMDRSYGAKAAA